MNIKKERLKFTCETCGVNFESPPWFGKRRFCSNSCHGKYLKGKTGTAKSFHWKLSNETKKRMSESWNDRKIQPWYEKYIEKVKEIGKKNYGRKMSLETREKMSKSKSEHPAKYWLGKKNLKISGDKHWSWKGGITPLKIKLRKSTDYKRWRKSIYERDNYTCVICGDSSGGNLEADHFPVPFRDIYVKEDVSLLWDINNGRTLCKDCHKKITYNKDL